MILVIITTRRTGYRTKGRRHFHTRPGPKNNLCLKTNKHVLRRPETCIRHALDCRYCISPFPESLRCCPGACLECRYQLTVASTYSVSLPAKLARHYVFTVVMASSKHYRSSLQRFPTDVLLKLFHFPTLSLKKPDCLAMVSRG